MKGLLDPGLPAVTPHLGAHKVRGDLVERRRSGVETFAEAMVYVDQG